MKEISAYSEKNTFNDLFNTLRSCKNPNEFDGISEAIQSKYEHAVLNTVIEKLGYNEDEQTTLINSYKTMGYDLTKTASSMNGDNPHLISNIETNRFRLSKQLEELKVLSSFDHSDEKNKRIEKIEKILEPFFEPVEAEVISSKISTKRKIPALKS